MKLKILVISVLLCMSLKAFSQTASINVKKVKEDKLELPVIKNPDSIETNTITTIQEEYGKKYDSLIKDSNAKIQEFTNKLKQNISITKMDSLVKLIKKEQKQIEIYTKNKIAKVASFNYNWFLPTKDKTQRENFYSELYDKKNNKTEYLNAFALNTNLNGVTAQSEILTDNINWFRVTLGTVVSSSNTSKQDDTTTIEEETQDQAFSRLINGGGNFYLDLTLPLITTYNGNSNDLVIGYCYMQMKGATDIKGFGNTIDSTTANGSIGLNGFISASSDSRNFTFFMQGNADYFFGGDDFYKNLNLENERSFLSAKLSTGVILMNKFKLSAILSTYGSDASIRSGNVIFGIQVL